MNLLRLLTVPGLQLGTLFTEGWRAARGESPYADVPAVERSPLVLAEVLLDQTFTVSVNVATGVPHPSTLRRQKRELSDALALYDAHGWLREPLAYHQHPPPARDVTILQERERIAGRQTAFNHIHFNSAYQPHRGEPGRERWLEIDANREAHAYVFEHEGRPRPWLVCVHGFGMGTPSANFPSFGARWLHEELGLNLLFPCLPLHGPRGEGRMSGSGLLTADYMNVVHSFSQAVWDIRRMIGWVRERGAPQVGLYGISLGGYNSALVSAFEEDLSCVIAGIPAVDFPMVARDNQPWIMQAYQTDEELEVDWALVRGVTQVVSPLAFESLVPKERRFIFAAVADRVARPNQARALWRHWDQPEIHWFQSGHVMGLFKQSARDFVATALEKSGLVEPQRSVA